MEEAGDPTKWDDMFASIKAKGYAGTPPTLISSSVPHLLLSLSSQLHHIPFPPPRSPALTASSQFLHTSRSLTSNSPSPSTPFHLPTPPPRLLSHICLAVSHPLSSPLLLPLALHSLSPSPSRHRGNHAGMEGQRRLAGTTCPKQNTICRTLRANCTRDTVHSNEFRGAFSRHVRY